MTIDLTFLWLDFLALIWFLCCWLGYDRYSRIKPNSLPAQLKHWRHSWALSMLKRENRMIDSQVINGLIQNVTFFASTTILILVGLFASLGAMEEAIILINKLPFSQATTQTQWGLKLGTLIVIFIYAFFKFGWAIKQHSYSAVVMASSPPPEEADSDEAKDYAERMAQLSTLGAWHSNDGIRAYYFALAALSWFIHSWAFIVTTAWVVMVIYRREFYSRTLKSVTYEEASE